MTPLFSGEWALDPTASLTLRWGLGLILAQAMLHKGRDLPGFRSHVLHYRLLPSRAAGLFAVALLGTEAIVSLVLLTQIGSGARASLAAALLLLVYSTAIAINLLRGRRDIDCGCTRPGSKRPIGGDLLVRNFILITLAAIASLPSTARTIVWMDFLTAAAGAMVIALLYAAADTAMANARSESGRIRGAASHDEIAQWSVAP